MSTNVRVLYIFANERKQMEQEWQEGIMPDTYFIGLNHLQKFGVKAEYIENKIINFIRNKSFNLTNIFLLFKIRKYDIVFSGSSLMIVFLAKVIFRFRKPKFVWYNTFFTNLLKRNRNDLKGWIIRKSIGALDAIICPSQAQKDFLVKEGFSQDKIYFIPTGVDVDFIALRQKVLPDYDGEKYILAVGRDMGRDYKTLIEAMRGLDIKLKIAALPRNFSGLDVNNLPENVEFLGFVPFNKLVGFYKNAEFVIISTKKEDDFDGSDCSGHLVMLDAMASGKALIASYRSTIGDYIKNGQEGILVEPGNQKELREVIEKLLKNPQLARDMGNKAREKAAEMLTTEIFAKNLAEIFDRIFQDLGK